MIAAKDLSDAVRLIYPNGCDCHREYEVSDDGIVFKAFANGLITVDKLLDHIDLKLDWYIPSLEAVEFFMFIRLVLGEEPENLNSKPQYFLIDSIFKNPNVEPFFQARGITMDEFPAETVVLCSREFSKSVLTTYIILYMAYKGTFAIYGKINYGLYVSDSMRNGVKKMMGRLKAVYYESEFLQAEFEEANFTQEECILVRHPRSPKERQLYDIYVNQQGKSPEMVPGRMKRTFKVDGLGCAALNLDAKLYTADGYTTIGSVQIGDEIYGADGKLTKVTYKSEVFEKPMYELLLEDGRKLNVCGDHINSIELKYDYKGGRPKYKNIDLTTTELLKQELYWTRQKRKKGKYVTSSEKLVWIKNCEPLQYSESELPVHPYVIGLLLGDGSVGNKYGSAALHMMESDMREVVKYIPYETTRWRVDPRSKSRLTTIGIPNIGNSIVHLKANITCKNKFIPEVYFTASIEQRLDVLRGLIDTDGEVKPDGKIKFYSTSKMLTDGVTRLVRSLGGSAFNHNRNNVSANGVESTSYIAEISLDMRVSNLPRKYNNQKPNRRRDHRVGVVALTRIETVKSQCIAVDNQEHQFIADDYFRTHNTSSRGASNALTRPQFVFIDDVVANEVDASSSTILNSIESTIEADIRGGLSGSGYFMVVIGTPYNKKDPVYRRVEEGLMLPVVFPRAAKMPEQGMREVDFESVWPDRHTFKKCKMEYKNAKKAEDDGNGYKMKKLTQEHYLRITNSKDSLIKDIDNLWFSSKSLGKHLDGYKLVLTTDYTASNELRGDFSVNYMWAVNSNCDWFMIDISVKRQTIEQQYNTTMQMVQKWVQRTGKSVEVAVELDGQQRINVYALKQLQIKENIWFTFSKQIGATAGAQGFSRKKAGGDKHSQFMRIHHLFQNGNIFFAEEFKDSPDMVELLEELKYITYDSINSKHDDALDGISAIGTLDIIYPGVDSAVSSKRNSSSEGYDPFWDEDEKRAPDAGAGY